MSSSNPWDIYGARVTALGATEREQSINREQMLIQRKLPSSLSYKHVKIDGVNSDVSIIKTKENNKKKIHAMPGEKLRCGSLVEWADNVWIVFEVDADDELYPSGTLLQCNFKVKWVNQDAQIVERYCVIEDGTKYLTGEDEGKVLSVGATRVAMTIAKDPETQRLPRDTRILVDDPGAEGILAFKITKPNRLFRIYNGEGTYRFVLTETNITENDNLEQMVADYYQYWPLEKPSAKAPDSTPIPSTTPAPGAGGGWL